jgi:hypothetical protein
MICVNKMIFIYYSNNDSLMNNRNNYDLYFSNMINYLEMFTKIFHNKNDLKYLKLKICVIIKILSSKENLLRIRNNTEIKEKYINIIQSINNNYNISNIYNTTLQSVINSLKTI